MPRPARRPIGTQSHSIGRRRARPLGAHGQQTIYRPCFTNVLDPRVDIPVRYGTPTLLWVGGDGITPTVGPVLTAAGAPGTVEGPHVTRHGTRLVDGTFDGSTDRYVSATSIDPALGEDWVFACLFRAPREPQGTNRFLFSTRTTGDGIQIYPFSGTTPYSIYAYVDGVGTVSIDAGDISYGARHVLLFIGDRDGNITSWLDHVAGGVAAHPAGAIGTGLGLGIAARPDGASRLDCGIAWLAWWTGVGIADRWNSDSAAMAKDLMWRATVGDGPVGAASYTCASPSSWFDLAGRWHMAAPSHPRSGDGGGIRVEGALTGKSYRNKNPQNANDITVTGAMVKAVANDAAALLANGADAWGPNVYSLVNATGVDQYAHASDTTGAVTAFSVQCIGRTVAGAGVRIGLYDTGTATWTDGAALAADYARTLAPDLTPANVNQRLAWLVPTGVTVYLIAHQLEAGERCTCPTPDHNTGPAAAINRSAAVLTTGIDPPDVGGSISLLMAPLGWSGQPAAANSVDCLGAVDICTIRAANGRFRVWDQTNNAEAPSGDTKVWADGVLVDTRHSWGSPGLYVYADGSEDTDVFDGTLPAGTVTLGRTAGVYAMAVIDMAIAIAYQRGPCPD